VNDDYRVKLDSFEGPLDLLLFLIRKNEVDIHDIPIAQITDQYLSFVAELHSLAANRIDIDAAGEFLVMAATLTEIKSRMLLPKPPASQNAGETSLSPAEDPRAELVRQLMEYKRYRDAADALENRGEQWGRRFGSARAGIDNAALEALVKDDDNVEVEDLNIIDLVEAFKRIAETVNFERLGDHQVTYDDTPIELHAADILTRLEENAKVEAQQLGELDMRDLFMTKKTRGEMVGLFLALLELVRNGKVKVRQDKGNEAILLRMAPPEESTAAANVVANEQA
jgi:segregation and condensation protein A